MNKMLKGNNGKLILIGGGVLLIIIISSLFMFFAGSQDSTPKQAQSGENTEPNVAVFPKTGTTSTVSPTSGPTLPPQTKELPYEVSVPEGWKLTSVGFPGGYSLMMRPPVLWIGDPIIVVEAYEGPTDPAPKAQLFANDGFAKSTIKVDNVESIKFSGTWHTRAVDGVVMQVENQERIVFVPQPDSLYSIKMYYSQSEPNPVYDQLFDQILSSFKIKK